LTNIDHQPLPKLHVKPRKKSADYTTKDKFPLLPLEECENALLAIKTTERLYPDELHKKRKIRKEILLDLGLGEGSWAGYPNITSEEIGSIIRQVGRSVFRYLIPLKASMLD
jgi:hypothetical protein